MPGASAPGKVLLCGGYAVLERPNVGLVLTTSARFHCDLTVEATDGAAPGVPDDGPVTCSLRVVSPQFASEDTVTFTCTPQRRCRLEGPASPFVRAALLTSLTVTCARMADWPQLRQRLHGRRLLLTLAADNAFYSQGPFLARSNAPVTRDAVYAVPPRNPDVRGPNGAVLKTGLGSSACLVTSIVGCVLSHFLPAESPNAVATTPSPEALDLVHRVAQLSHCHAQGKVGSGFDVCAAVYGGGAYQRFSPQVLERALALLEAEGTEGVNAGLLAAALGVEDGAAPTLAPWDHVFRPQGLPAPLSLALADIRCGSTSPGMAAAVLRWRASAPEAERKLWTNLTALNTRLIEHLGILGVLGDRDPPAHQADMRSLSRLPFERWAVAFLPSEVLGCLVALRTTHGAIRSLLKRIGELSGVEIEPDTQTALIEATLAMPGVLIAGVPGAGGYDAVFAVLLHPEARAAVERLWLGHRPGTDNLPGILPLTLDLDPCGLLLQ